MKRRFGLPIAVALAAHAFVLFGFRAPVRVLVAAAPPRPDTTHLVQVDDPVDTTDTSAENLPPSPAQGRKDSSEPDPVLTRTDVDTSSVEITETDLSQPDIHRLVEPGTIDPVHFGPGGDRTGPVIDPRRLDHAPKARFQAPPAYPTEAKASRLTGTVTVEFVVGKTGRVLEADVVRSTDPAFEEETLRAVRNWVFEPGLLNGRPVSFRMEVPVLFRLDGN
jgi:protein TonB